MQRAIGHNDHAFWAAAINHAAHGARHQHFGQDGSLIGGQHSRVGMDDARQTRPPARSRMSAKY